MRDPSSTPPLPTEDEGRFPAGAAILIAIAVSALLWLAAILVFWMP